jgi:hypothetical protein
MVAPVRPRVGRAFAAAGLAAWVGGALSGVVVRAGDTAATMFAQTLVHLWFGWPVALAALLVAAAAHAALRRTRWLRRRVVIGVGAVAGAGAVGWMRHPGVIGWCAAVGALTGALWWRVAFGRAALPVRET